MNWNRIGPILLVVGVSIALIAVFKPYAQHQLIVSPALGDSAEVYDVAELRELALQRAAVFGFSGSFETEQSYLITLGQWLTLRRSDVRLTGGLTRESPVYVLQGTGQFTTFGQPAYDHVTIAVGLEREDMLWIHYSPPDAPKLIIDTTVEDVPLNLTQPVSSLMRVTQTAEASSSGGEAP